MCNRSVTVVGTYELRSLAGFREWLESLADETSQFLIAARLERLRHGLLGDARSVGGGVSELRLHRSPGYRVCFTRRGGRIILLLAGSTKRTQTRDIERAQVLVAELEERSKR